MARKDSTRQGEKLKNYCACCKQETWHVVKEYVTRDCSNKEQEIYAHEDLMIVECLGCEHRSYRTELHCSEYEYFDEDGNVHYEPDVNCYPARLKVEAIDLFDSTRFPHKVRTIYSETIKAINADCTLLAAAGFRALIEAICSNRNVTGKNLMVKINNLCKAGHITKSERDRLHALRFVGNDSIHSITPPSPEQLKVMVEIAHTILNNLYITDKHVEDALKVPFKKDYQFIYELESKIATLAAGNVFKLKDLFKGDNRLLEDDLNEFENFVTQKINSGEITGIQLDVVDADHQQYKKR